MDEVGYTHSGIKFSPEEMMLGICLLRTGWHQRPQHEFKGPKPLHALWDLRKILSRAVNAMGVTRRYLKAGG